MIPGDEPGAVAVWAYRRIMDQFISGTSAGDPVFMDAFRFLIQATGGPLDQGAPADLTDAVAAEYVWADRVPSRDAKLPAIILSASEATDTRRLGAEGRFMSTVPLSVKVVLRGASYAPALRFAPHLYRLIQGNRNETFTVDMASGERATILTAERQGTFRYPETTDGLEYRHIGANFTVTIQ